MHACSGILQMAVDLEDGAPASESLGTVDAAVPPMADHGKAASSTLR
jgi:hypothetical protein